MISENTLHDKPQNTVDDQGYNLRGYCQNYEKINRLSFNDDLHYLEILEK